MPVRVLPAHGVGGGMERVSWAVAAGLAGRGHDVTAVTTSLPPGRREEPEPGVRVLDLPGSTWRRYRQGWWDDSYAALGDEHARTPYDVILSQSAGGLGYLGRASRDLGVPSAVLMHGSARGQLRTAWRGAGSLRGLYRLGRTSWRLPPHLRRWRLAAGSVGHWVAVSAEVAVECERELGVPHRRMTVVPPGVDVNRFRPDPPAGAAVRRRLGIPAVAPVLVLATRLEREKGVHVALAAAARVRAHHPDLHVVVAGAGHADRALRRRASGLGLGDACRFLGLVGHGDLPGVLASADVFVLPSLCAEACPVSAVEAGAAGLPVVASRSAGAAAVVLDGVTGRLVPPGDAGAMAGEVLGLLADERGRRRMGERGRREATTRLSEAAMVDAVEDVLHDVAGSRRDAPRRTE